MLYLSEILIQHHDLESFQDLVNIVRERGQTGERFFSMDVIPPFSDTPENWDSMLEAAFTETRVRP